jgi:hypothetical protein
MRIDQEIVEEHAATFDSKARLTPFWKEFFYPVRISINDAKTTILIFA